MTVANSGDRLLAAVTALLFECYVMWLIYICEGLTYLTVSIRHAKTSAGKYFWKGSGVGFVTDADADADKGNPLEAGLDEQSGPDELPDGESPGGDNSEEEAGHSREDESGL